MLRVTLEALQASLGLEADLEVIVVDDGSTDDTTELLATAVYPKLSLRWLSGTNCGPATARNRGIALATAPRVLLLGDDTIPAPQTVSVHLRAPAGREVAVQGRIDWDPTQEITRVMHFLAPAGPQFYFKGLTEGQEIDWGTILGSNLSAPTAWFRQEPFNERFPIAGFEDTEQAYRWSRRGWKGVFSSQAICWHRHRYDSIADFYERQRRVGQAARLAVGLHPGLFPRTVLQPSLVAVVFLVRHLLRVLSRRHRLEDRWDVASRWAFLRGFLAHPSPGGLY